MNDCLLFLKMTIVHPYFYCKQNIPNLTHNQLSNKYGSPALLAEIVAKCYLYLIETIVFF